MQKWESIIFSCGPTHILIYCYWLFPCKVSELQELCKLCDERDTDVRITTKKLAMVSLLTVFKDIVPGWVCCHSACCFTFYSYM